MANSVDPDQTAPIGAVCSGPTLFASILNLSVMLGNYLQQMTSADDIFRCIFFLALLGLRVISLAGEIPKNHDILREAYSLCYRLPVLNTYKFKEDFFNVSIL